MRLRITFEKTAAMRFTGHLDLHRSWERIFRRAGLPLAYSQGFNPHPKLNLASALPLGFTSEAEVLDAWLEEELPLQQIEQSLIPALPPGIRLTGLEAVDERLPALQTAVEASDYQITFLEPAADLEDKAAALLSAASLMRRRRNKDYDLRPLIQSLQVLDPDAAGQPRLAVRLSAREGATGRPEELIEALGLTPELASIHRVRLIFRTD